MIELREAELPEEKRDKNKMRHSRLPGCCGMGKICKNVMLNLFQSRSKFGKILK